MPELVSTEQEEEVVTAHITTPGLRREVQKASDGRVRVAFTRMPGLDTAALVNDLRRETGAEVRFDHGSRALYATDSSNYRQVPVGVVVPRTKEDVVRAMAV